MCSDSYLIPILSFFFLYLPYIPYFLIRRMFYFLVIKSGFYAVHGVYHVSQKGKEAVDKDEPVMLPVSFYESTSLKASTPSQSPGVYANHESKEKRVRNGKQSNIHFCSV